MVWDVECGGGECHATAIRRMKDEMYKAKSKHIRNEEKLNPVVIFGFFSLLHELCVSFSLSLFLILSLLVVYGHVHSLAPSRG